MLSRRWLSQQRIQVILGKLAGLYGAGIQAGGLWKGGNQLRDQLGAFQRFGLNVGSGGLDKIAVGH